MFKKYYEEANNALPVNNDLKEELLNMSAEKHNLSIFSISKIFKYALPVAMAFILIISLPALHNINQEETKNTMNDSNIPENTDSINKGNGSDTPPNSQNTINNDVVMDKNTSNDTDNFANAKSMPNARITPEYDIMLFENSIDEKSIAQPIFDLSSLVLPENMILVNNSDGSTPYIYENSNKSLILYVSNDQSLFSEIAPTDMIDENSAIIENNGQYTGYIRNDNLHFKAECHNFSKDEILNLINSLK